MPHSTQQHSVARPCSKSRTMPQVCVDVASARLAVACCLMLHGLKIWSANCRSYQRKPRGIWWVRSKGFQNGISQFEKKKRSSPVSFYSFCNLKKVCKKIMFSWGRVHIGGICQATFATRQSCSLLHSATGCSVDAPLEPVLLRPHLA